MNKALKKVLIIAAASVGAVLCLIGLVLGGLNIIKFPLYSEYYGAKTDVCINPGLNDGFVCQGICAYEEGGRIFVSGYMTDDRPSRIYVTDTQNDSYYVELAKADGSDFTGHAGGIAINGSTLYIANGGKLHLVSLTDILNAKNSDRVQIQDSIPVNNSASFVYSDDSYIYVGEFHNGEKYVTEHPYDTADGRYHAIVSRYPLSEMVIGDDTDNTPRPDRVYSIRDKVQGICFTAGGRVVLSTSYGVADSIYYIYNESDATDSGHTLDGAPVYYLDRVEREIKGPAMSEDLDYYEGKVITLSESASNKYIFGKFFFADKIVALDIDK